MSLRARLFLLFGTLLLLLAGAQALLTHRLAADLTGELGKVALHVGRDVVSVFAFRTDPVAAGGGATGESSSPSGEMRWVTTWPAPAAPPAATAATPPAAPHRVIVRHEPAPPGPPASPGPGDATPTTEPPASAPTGGISYQYRIQTVSLADGETTTREVRTVIDGVAGDGPSSGAPTPAGPDAAGGGLAPLGHLLATGLADPAAIELVLERAARDAARDEADRLALVGPHFSKRIEIPQAGMRAAVERFRDRLLLGSLALAVGGIVVAALLAHRVSRPLRALAGAARAIGGGALGTQVADPVAPGRAGDEVTAALAAFNQMSLRLAALDAEARAMREHQHLAELGELARGLAHTLRNPLHGLGLAIEGLLAQAACGAQPEELAELAATARAQIARVDHTVRALLALAGNGAASAETVDLEALVQGVALEALQDAHGRVAIEVTTAASFAPGTTLHAVPAELRAMVQALVVNAVEASPDGAAVRITLTAAAADEQPSRLGVEVVDAGPGIPAAIRARLFEPHTTSKPAGAGMGLYLAHRLAVGRYAGSLALVDHPAGGTLARLTLADREPGAGAEAAA